MRRKENCLKVMFKFENTVKQKGKIVLEEWYTKRGGYQDGTSL